MSYELSGERHEGGSCRGSVVSLTEGGESGSRGSYSVSRSGTFPRSLSGSSAPRSRAGSLRRTSSRESVCSTEWGTNTSTARTTTTSTGLLSTNGTSTASGGGAVSRAGGFGSLLSGFARRGSGTFTDAGTASETDATSHRGGSGTLTSGVTSGDTSGSDTRNSSSMEEDEEESTFSEKMGPPPAAIVLSNSAKSSASSTLLPSSFTEEMSKTTASSAVQKNLLLRSRSGSLAEGGSAACPGEVESSSSSTRSSSSASRRQEAVNNDGNALFDPRRERSMYCRGRSNLHPHVSPLPPSSHCRSGSTNPADDILAVARTKTLSSDLCHRGTPSVSSDSKVRRPVAALRSIPYVHGGYMAAGPLLLQNPEWMSILRRLMPESHADSMRLPKLGNGFGVLGADRDAPADPVRVMKWAENNPVVAAYGILNSDGGRREQKEGKVEARQSEGESGGEGGGGVSRFANLRKMRRRAWKDEDVQSNASETTPIMSSHRKKKSPPVSLKPALEWDVFLDPNLVRKVDDAIAHAADLWEKEKTARCDYASCIAADIDVERQVGRLMSRMMLAHGSTAQLVAEAVGMMSRYNFSQVVEKGESHRLHRRKSRRLTVSVTQQEGNRGHPRRGNCNFLISSNNEVIMEEAVEVEGKSFTGASGIFVERWLSLFARALQLGTTGEVLSTADQSALLLASGNTHSSSDSDLNQTLSGGTTAVPPGDEVVQEAPPLCGIFLCLGMDDPNSAKADHAKTSMADSTRIIKSILGGPLRVVLDLKSRRVPSRVWARLVDNLRSRGLAVDGLGSFDIDELRGITSCSSTPVTGILFFHSAGDLQRACHANEVHRGDTVYFNAGSLLWRKPSILEATTTGCCHSRLASSDASYQDNDLTLPEHDGNNVPGFKTKKAPSSEYNFQPYAYPHSELGTLSDARPHASTLQDYQRHFDLNIGLYVQEFSIGEGALDAIVRFVNAHPSIYNLGLAWGGLNGATVQGIRGDGYWNQRYMGRNWDPTAKPTNGMRLLHPEDHHFVQKAIMAGACGQIGTVNDMGGDATGDGASLQIEACQSTHTACHHTT